MEGWFRGLALSNVRPASLRETDYLSFGLKQVARRRFPTFPPWSHQWKRRRGNNFKGNENLKLINRQSPFFAVCLDGGLAGCVCSFLIV